MGYTEPENLCKRLELCDDTNTDPFTGKVKAQVTTEGLSDSEAEDCDEFIEHSLLAEVA